MPEDLRRIGSQAGKHAAQAPIPRELEEYDTMVIEEDESLFVLDYFDEGKGDFTIKGDMHIAEWNEELVGISQLEAAKTALRNDLDTHRFDFTNPHETGLEKARAENDTFDGDVNMGGNLLDNRSGYWASDVNTTDSNVQNGEYLRCFNVVEVNDGPYTKDSDRQISVTKDGRYRVTWSVVFDKNNGNSVNTGDGNDGTSPSDVPVTETSMELRPYIGGNSKYENRTVCVVGGYDGAARAGTSGEYVYNMTAGESIQFRADRTDGENTTIDAYESHTTIEYLG